MTLSIKMSDYDKLGEMELVELLSSLELLYLNKDSEENIKWLIENKISTNYSLLINFIFDEGDKEWINKVDIYNISREQIFTLLSIIKKELIRREVTFLSTSIWTQIK